MKRIAVTLVLLTSFLLLAACGLGQDPLKVVAAYQDAEVAGNLDKALTYLADDAVYVIGGDSFFQGIPRHGPFDGEYEGKDAVRELLADLQRSTTAGVLTTERGQIRVNGDEVRLDVKIRWAGQLVRESHDLYLVRKGRIVYVGPENAAAELGLCCSDGGT